MSWRSILRAVGGGSPAKTSVCLVTNELYPFASGGIGRLMHNWLQQNAELGHPVKLNLLLPASLAGKRAGIEALCARFDASCHFCSRDDLKETRLGTMLRDLPLDHWDYTRPYAESYQYFATLLRLERQGVRFDLVEFPDYGGWGAIAIEAKRAGIAFAKSALSVRLHSTYGIIVATERYYHNPTGFGSGTVDLERFALSHADHVVAHQPAILDYNVQFYRLETAWRGKTHVETPPIVLEAFELGRRETPVRRFVFSSRLQPFKRPDLFVRAACHYFARYPDDDAEALIVSYGWDTAYIDTLKLIIPEALKDRIRFVLDLQGQERQDVLAGAVIMVPSDFESYCLFAYESAAMKRRVLLRRDCLAFGADPGWVDGENCLLFGSDPAEIATVMRRALDWQPTTHRITTPSVPYWTEVPRRPEPVPPGPAVRQHVIVHGVDSTTAFDRALTMVSPVAAERTTIVVSPAVSRPAAEAGTRVEIVAAACNDNDFGEVWQLAVGSTADVVTFVDARGVIDPLFFKVADNTFRLRPDLGVLTANEALVDARGDVPLGFRPVAGEHLLSGVAGLDTVGRVVSVRRSLIQSTRYPSEARSFAPTALFSGLALGGTSICVLPETYTTGTQDSIASRDPRAITTRLGDLTSAQLGCGFGIGVPVKPSETAPGALSIVRTVVQPDVPVERLRPVDRLPWGDPVSYNHDHNGLLVHPVDDGPTIARLSLPHNGFAASRFFVEIRNAQDDNHGFRFGLLLGSGPIRDRASLQRWIAGHPEDGLTTIEPLAHQFVYADADPLVRETHLYLVTYPAAGWSAHRCLAVVLSYGALYH